MCRYFILSIYSILMTGGGFTPNFSLMILNLLCCAPEYLTPPASATSASLSLSGSPGTRTGRPGSAGSRSRNVSRRLCSLRENSGPAPHTPGSRAMKQWDKPPGASERPHWRMCGPQVPPGWQHGQHSPACVTLIVVWWPDMTPQRTSTMRARPYPLYPPVSSWPPRGRPAPSLMASRGSEVTRPRPSTAHLRSAMVN